MNNPIPEHQSYVQPSAGAQLRAYREHLQLTVDDVAHHLKPARRQVLAIENDELDALPGPTFVRGFIRNYARLLRIDAQPLLEASGLTSAPSAPIDRIGETMGELPADDRPASGSWTRLLIPTGLVLVLAAGITLYEMGGVTGVTGKKARKEAATEAAQPAAPPAGDAATPSGNAESVGPADASPTSTSTSPPLPPPAAPASGAASPAPAVPSAASAPTAAASTPVPSATPVTGGRASDRKSADSGTAGAGTAGPKAATSPAAATAATSPTDASSATATVQVALSAPSWVEIRDAAGSTLVSGILQANASRTVTGKPPFSVKLGKASAVQLQYNGTPVALAPHTQREIARLTLPPAAR